MCEPRTVTCVSAQSDPSLLSAHRNLGPLATHRMRSQTDQTANIYVDLTLPWALDPRPSYTKEFNHDIIVVVLSLGAQHWENGTGRSGMTGWHVTQLAFYVNLHRAVIGPSAALTGRWRPDIDLRRMLTGNYVMCLARYILVRRHSKGEYWVPCHIKTLSQYH